MPARIRHHNYEHHYLGRDSLALGRDILDGRDSHFFANAAKSGFVS